MHLYSLCSRDGQTRSACNASHRSTVQCLLTPASRYQCARQDCSTVALYPCALRATALSPLLLLHSVLRSPDTASTCCFITPLTPCNCQWISRSLVMLQHRLQLMTRCFTNDEAASPMLNLARVKRLCRTPPSLQSATGVAQGEGRDSDMK